MEDTKELITTDDIRSKVYIIRGQQVMLDKDLAEIYGYEVKRLNEQVKRNISRFPEDFMFQLNREEIPEGFSKSQFATLNEKSNRQGSNIKKMPFAFTEQGIYMLATVLMQDKRWLGEAVINVLDNAIKYSPDGSKIFIRLQKRNDLVRMEIEDQGIGIPQNEYHKIFQRFYRGSSKEVREESGTGIGLFLSREIIEKHGGTIMVTSGKKKKGSTFVIQLPYVG